MTRIRGRRALLMILLFPMLAACSLTAPDPGAVTREGDVVLGHGTVRWYEIEGGFFAILGTDGVTYDPINLSAEYERDGLPVRFRARIRDDMGSIHMVGPMVELIEIERR